jgi:putative transposase
VSPARRRQAVLMLMDRLEISERRACRAIDHPRSTQRRPAPVPGNEEEQLRTRLRKLARAHPRYGYRRMTTILRREGYCVNHKRIQRLCRDEGLRVLKKAKKRSRIGTSETDGTRLRATYPNHVWAIDFQFDQTTNLKTLKLLNITDEFTKEALAIEVDRSITADDTVEVLEAIVASRGAPDFLRMDNGPELTANALRDWCRFSLSGSVYIEPGSPWENPFIESFNGKLRDELLNVEAFETLLEAQVLAEDFRIEYNTYRPHSSLGGLTPAEFAEQWRQNQPGLSKMVDH